MQPPIPPTPDYLERVPQTPCVPEDPSPSRQTVTFERTEASPSERGIPITELANRSSGSATPIMKGGSDKVGAWMACNSHKKIKVWLTWPGYEQLQWSHSLNVFTPVGPITRSQLAVLVALIISSFVENIRTLPADSRRPPQFELAERSGSPVRVDNLVLGSLWNVADDNWMAEIYVERR
ncbi:hypothetical protein CONPUDRAFT_143454 [Coniophora puteana RWD-64-598 SS2]|uniref:Uncharacterized protein n=1 Tax=Coniophora puteana (strain RWD-64-598) TaxID=741705 RepID=A0A5M3MRN1_CONPW|nr:uncharacterized protein CONPUDRAFT_143454 [Coniophora puteana RWD-64-598 SS2]EIW81750.1 hypothetical protein CONPUDRAFT_143454 [Coniophora puteana RWD-64-598 SS2]